MGEEAEAGRTFQSGRAIASAVEKGLKRPKSAAYMASKYGDGTKTEIKEVRELAG